MEENCVHDILSDQMDTAKIASTKEITSTQDAETDEYLCITLYDNKDMFSKLRNATPGPDSDCYKDLAEMYNLILKGNLCKEHY